MKLYKVIFFGFQFVASLTASCCKANLLSIEGDTLIQGSRFQTYLIQEGDTLIQGPRFQTYLTPHHKFNFLWEEVALYKMQFLFQIFCNFHTWLQSANWLHIHTSVTYKSLRYMTPTLYEWVASYKMKFISYFPFRFEFVAIPTLCKWLQSANWLHIKGDILHGVHLYMIYLRVPVLRKSISNYLYF